MVLSNKKLKQKLRAELTESLAKSVALTDPHSDARLELGPNTQPQVSLKELLDSASQRPRLSKREKRRKTLPLQGTEAVKRSSSSSSIGNSEENKDNEEEKEGGSEGLGEKKNKKKEKRKREEVEEVKDGDVKEAKQSKNKKKKKKKKKTKTKSAKNEEENKGAELGSEAQRVTDTNSNGDSQAHEEVTPKVYVGGIPYYSTEDDIRSYFEGCGTITEIDCMKFPETGKFRGISIISFKTEAAAKRALALDGSDMGGLYLKIQPYKVTRANKASHFSPEIVEGYNRIYVGNLPWDVTEDDLRKLLSDCNISSIRFGADKETGEFRGYAHVDFSDSMSLTMALKLDQQIVCGRPVKISCAVPKKGAGADSTDTRSAPARQETENLESAGSSATSGKIRRRTCYECGEKGHLSSACPKKQNADPTNSEAS
ncbi:protein gar2 [Juglans regia]|uniref:Protein gar2 n=2 Tax=Juglans regia TaxID=51240 RepID=A0A2I4FY15_JUGRE|nr:protein gar2 [Juglans regia]